MPALASIADRGCINISSSSIVGDVVTIVPQGYGANSYWRTFYFKITGASSWQPDFKCDWTDSYEYSLVNAAADLHPRYTYTPDDPSSWVTASAVSQDGTNLTWTFDEAFTSDTVYIALYEIVTVGMVEDWVNSLTGITQTPTAIAYGGDTYQFDSIPSATDENSRVIPAQKQISFKFGTGSTLVVLTAGIHAAEDSSQIYLMAMVDFLLGSNPVAVRAREDFTFLVYPLVNPQGRYGGHYRCTFESLALVDTDPNRDWGTFDLVCNQNLRDAILTDTGGLSNIDWHFECHDMPQDARLYTSNDPLSAGDTEFWGYISSYHNILTSITYHNPGDSMRIYYSSYAAQSITVEYSYGQFEDNWTNLALLGETFAYALAHMEWTTSTNTRDLIDFGNNNSSRYYTIPSDSLMAFPNDDWTLGFWVDIEENSGSYYQYAFCMGVHLTNNLVMVYFNEGSTTVQAQIRDSSGTVITLSGAGGGGDAVKKLLIIRRRGAYLAMFTCDEGGNVELIDSTPVTFGAINAGATYIGCRDDVDANRMYEEHMGGLFKCDFPIQRWEIEAIAHGIAKPADFGTLALDLAMDSPDATLTDAASGLTATRNGSSWPTPSISVAYPATLLSINLPVAWKVLAEKSVATSWKLFDLKDQSSAWKISTELSKGSTWKILKRRICEFFLGDACRHNYAGGMEGVE